MKSKDDRKDFDGILASLSERELTAWERERLWQLLAEHDEWVAEYVDHCALPALLEDLDPVAAEGAGFDVPADNVVHLPATRRGVTPGSGGVNRMDRWARRVLAVTMTAAAVTLTAVFMGESSPFRPGDTLVASAEGPVPGEIQRETPEQAYQQAVAALPISGSQSRPPTSFSSAEGDAGKAKGIRFNRDIRPVLSEYCFGCHGPGTKKAGLRLDRFADATADLGGYAALVAGDPEMSEAVIRMHSSDPDEIMPPPESHKVMSAEEKKLIEDWIAEGAPFEEHWAFTPIEKPSVPHSPEAALWARNPIDFFTHSVMEEAGLAPNEEAGRRTLARRAALDVTGLPPSREALEAFLSDRSPGAYGRYLDSLFASEHFGEHRARFWLDAARYGDTHGMHIDNYREIWPYRDWVIRAFNTNMPFDQFVVEQIAGDLLPGATLDQRIATGFNRCNVTTSEGGSIPEEVNVRYMIDRVETTSTVFLGLTTGCAACHDHKYDPISQKDFYALGAFFNNTTQPAMDGNQRDTPPVIVLPQKEYKGEWGSVASEMREIREKMKKRRFTVRQSDAFAVWKEKDGAGSIALDHPDLSRELALHVPLQLSSGRLSLVARGKPQEISMPPHLSEAEDSPVGKGVFFKEKKGIVIGSGLKIDADSPFTIAFWLRPSDTVRTRTLLASRWPEKKGKRAFELNLAATNQLTASFGEEGKQKGKGRRLEGRLAGEMGIEPGRWQHVVIRYSGGRATSAFTVLVDGELRPIRVGTEEFLTGELQIDSPLFVAPTFEGGGLADLRIYDRWLTDEEAAVVASAGVETDRKREERELLNVYLNTEDARYRALSQELVALQTRRDFIAFRSPTTMVMREKPNGKPRAWILERGEYDQRKEEVAPAVPTVLPPLPEGVPANRLGLARWIVDSENPLTARVTANRFWQQVFGTGLVKTSEDVGVMGENPSHPELLDWLAWTFVDSGWDVRHVFRLMLESATYRQEGKTSPEKLARDPENRLLSRGPRIRLDAEVLRDQALAVSGLLNREVGGPSVKPYQPPGLWKTVAMLQSNTKEFKQDSGNDLYRRSLYTFWKRTSPPPSMAAFDAPTREGCTVRRERTNTPLQALVLLNDPQYVEAARSLAAGALGRLGAAGQRELATEIVSRATGRVPDGAEIDILEEAAEKFHRRFQGEPEAARKLIAVGESAVPADLDPVALATWTMVANTVLNRDDVINKN